MGESDYTGWFAVYDSEKEGWTDENNWDYVPCTYLQVGVCWRGSDGEERDWVEEEVPDGWDCDDEELYEELERSICSEHGFDWDADRFDLSKPGGPDRFVG